MDAHISRQFRLQKGAFMARVTVEDCIDKVDNRFELVLLARPSRPPDLAGRA
jgi:hypothetical protein